LHQIGAHRLQPGKECGFEEDINIPLIVRGPGVPAGETSKIVTTHIDLAPTLLKLAGAPLREDFDGEAIPLTAEGLNDAKDTRKETVAVEYWGFAAFEGEFYEKDRLIWNNTYKALRIIGKGYNLYYAVWCNNEHEFYDLSRDPYQLDNLLHSSAKTPDNLLGLPFDKVIARLDALLFVLKSCKGRVCVRPWKALHPEGDVGNLHDALSHRFDDFYETQQAKVSYSHCETGYILDSEGPQFETDGLVYRHGLKWDHWT
jgi:hypothetical protein